MLKYIKIKFQVYCYYHIFYNNHSSVFHILLLRMYDIPSLWPGIPQLIDLFRGYANIFCARFIFLLNENNVWTRFVNGGWRGRGNH